MKRDIIKAIIVEAFTKEKFEVTCNACIHARNFMRYTGKVKNCTKLFGKRLQRVEGYLSDKMSEKIFLNVNNGRFFIDISNATFSLLSLEDALARADISEMDLPVIIGEECDGSIFAIDLAKASNLLVFGDDEFSKTNILKSFKRTLLRNNSQVEICLFDIDLSTGDVYCNDSEFQKFASKKWFKEKILTSCWTFINGFLKMNLCVEWIF